MALIWVPQSPWHLVVTGLGLLLLVMLLLAVWKGRLSQWRHRPPVRRLILVLSMLAALLLVLAAWHPQLKRPSKGQPVQLAIVLDVSQSVRGGPGGWQQGRDRVQRLVSAWVDALPADMRRVGTAAIFTVQEQATLTVPRHPLNELVARLGSLDETRFAAGEGSHLAAGLVRAGTWLDPAKGQGVCVLVSDGHQTAGDVLAAAADLTRKGIPVHVIPATGAGPDLDWTATDLPEQIGAMAPTYLRAVLRNGLTKPVQASLTLSLNGGLETLTESAKTSSKQMEIEAGGWRRLRWPLKFRGTGIQFADLTLEDGGSRPRQRRFFSYVQQAPRLLIVGGDFRIVDSLPEEMIKADLVGPDAVLASLRANHYDAVVLAGVIAGDIGRRGLEQIAWSVEKEGMGLFFLNGDHAGLDEETETVLMSYNDTILEALLPVSSRPRPYTPEAPGRQVVVLLDASGSMGGWRMRKSQEIVAYIIEHLLRPRDRLYLLTFSTGARILVDNRYMDQAGKYEALAALWSIKAGGGTDPAYALDLLGRRRLRNCGLIFLSDGEFDQVSYRPDCRATVFALGRQTVQESSPLWQIADPFPVTQGFNPAGIEMPYFEQKVRNRFFERGSFVPMSMDLFLSRSDRLPMPRLPLMGSAVTFAKDEAKLIAVRPKLTDPVLAYAVRGLGEVGAFTGAVNQAWLSREEGRAALSAWVLRTVGFTARDRYRFLVRDLGNALELEVALVAHGGRLPTVNQLYADLVVPANPGQGISFIPDPQTPGLFRGRIRLNQIDSVTRAKLVLRESGPEAVSRSQAIPLFLPPAGDPSVSVAAERYSHGTQASLLAAIADLTGGTFEPGKETWVFPMTPDRIPPIALWPWLLVLAMACHLLAVALQRLAN